MITIEVIITLLASLSVGAIIMGLLQRFWSNRDRKSKVLIDNLGKEIDQDVVAFNAFASRLETVETRLDGVSQQLTEQRVENAKLESENLRLSKENEKQEEEIQRQRGRIHEFANKLNEKEFQIIELKESLKRRDKDVDTLRSELKFTIQELNSLKRKIATIEKTAEKDPAQT